MNQKTYKELGDAILFKQPPIFLPVLVEQINPASGYLGMKFSIDNSIPDGTVCVDEPEPFRFDNLEKIKCELTSYLPDLKVI